MSVQQVLFPNQTYSFMETRSIGAIHRPQENLPHHIVTEVIGNFTFTGSEENQVHIAEQIASNAYRNINDLLDTIKGYTRRKTFDKEAAFVKNSAYFKNYFKK